VAAAQNHRRLIMGRFSVLGSLIVVVLLSILALPAQPVILAQEATPGAEEFAPEGVTFEPLALATGLALPSTGELFLARFGLEPGAALPLEPGDPAYALAAVESGALTIRVDGPLTVTRAEEMAGVMAEEGVPATETIAAGQEVTLSAGDSALFPPNAGGEIRNDGQEPVSGTVALVGPPVAEGTPVAGTPAP
jgi:quercetin dioxygenase-like cupin family protein